MLDRCFENPRTLDRLRTGPLGSYVDGFAASLLTSGYARNTVRIHLRFVGKLSLWLGRQNLAVADLDECNIDRFLRQQKRQDRIRRIGHVAAARLLLDYLGASGIVARKACQAPQGDAPSAAEVDYARYLERERGLSEGTRGNYLSIVRRFLSERFVAGRIEVAALRPDDVTRFILRHANDHSRSRAKMLACALRSFLRYLRLRGHIGADLASAVPAVAHWRLSTVPGFLKPHEVQRVLDSCDRTAAEGKRSYAVLLLLARLGLRGGEAAAMKLDDFRWETGEFLVRGKNAWMERLPLPQDVGEAVADYLCNARPSCSTRQVFVSLTAPCRPLKGSAAIGHIVRRSLGRAGLHPPRSGAHLFRHSLATQMLAGGATLAEIGEILRHRSLDTTEIYAKVDLTALRRLVQPWPGDAR